MGRLRFLFCFLLWLLLAGGLSGCSGHQETKAPPDLTLPLMPSASGRAASSAVPSSAGSKASATSEITVSSEASSLVPESGPGASDPASLPPSAEESSSSPYAADEERIRYFLDQLNPRSRLFQLMITAPQAISRDTPVLKPDEEALASLPVAGILYSAENMESREQLQALIEGHQEAAPLPLFIGVSEEGGRSSQVMKTLGTTPVKNMYTYRGDGIERARNNARIIGTDLRQLGFNLDLAPVADVWSDPENQTIGERAYSDSFSKAAELVAAAVEGFHDAEMICVLKHFPGQGEARGTSPESTAVVDKKIQALREEEWLPFLAGSRAGADMVMVGDFIAADIDPDASAVFSEKIVSELLRQELGYQGLIITDTLDLAAKNAGISPGEACLQALLAGCDLLLCPADQPDALAECADYLEAALKDGRLSEERVEESLRRVLALKLKAGLIR